MGVEDSNLDFNKIEKILEEQYNIIPLDILPINRGTSNLFEIVTGKDKYILKEFTSKRKEETIIKEINIINFLHDRKVKVPVYVKTIEDKYFTKNEGRIIIVQEFIEGHTIEDNTSDYNQVIQCAGILGKLVRELMNYPELSEENVIEEYFSLNRLQKGIEKMQTLITKIDKSNIYQKQIVEDLKFKIEISEKFVKKFDFDIVDKLTKLNSHGDYCTQQLIYGNNGEVTIIDFEKARKLPIVWEVMRSFCYCDKEIANGNLNIETLGDYFKEFSKYISLNEYDLKYAADLYLLQLISSAFGYEEYYNNSKQIDLLNFAFFRTNLCKIIYKNLKPIRNKLILL